MLKSSKNHTPILFLLVLSSLLIAGMIGEIFLRCYGETDSDGNFYIGGLHCYPYQFPHKTLTARLKPHFTATGSFVRYDPLTGWAPKSKTVSKNGLYSFNSDGIRTRSIDTTFSKEPVKGTMRIALFGDSFTMGEDVDYQNTWGSYLETDLSRRGMNAEVINFGVSAYGIDQAFLRWKELGRAFHPQIVILGLQLEDIYRSGNLLRALYVPKGLPLSKPRFILQNNQLKLINSPSVPFEKIETLINHFPDWEFAAYEYWYDPKAYKKQIFLKSRLISYLYTLYQSNTPQAKAKQYDLINLNLKIILEFKKEVEEDGGQFYVIYLPVPRELVPMLSGHKSEEQHLLDLLINARVEVIDPSEKILMQVHNYNFDTLIPYHYTALTNKIIADTINPKIKNPF